MTKGDETRQMILLRAAEVFNRKGYSGASMADIMQATGLEKGGIYRHFASKDDLALEAFDFAVDMVRQEFQHALKDKRDAMDRLRAIVGVYRAMPEGLPVAGGCPVLNTAIEADDTHPVLRDHARRTMDEWREYIRRTAAKGIERGQIRPQVDPDELATFMIAMLEGAIMLTKLYDDTTHMNRTVRYLESYLETTVQL
ncbi:MAG TPA: TetR/AcrR family transcriptional regulator [Phototrophicaceae bacterium]|nr:TetR/AcrR family transcriptional regulator [Phototrophicaceae bacterium]